MYSKASQGQEWAAISLEKIRFGGTTCLEKNYDTYKVTRNVVKPSLDQAENNNSNQVD